MIIHCYKCATVLDLPSQVGFKETCHKCDADVHCCRNCKFYDPAAYNSCSENQADRVVEKEKANFCDYFRLADGSSANADTKIEKKSTDVKKSLDDLFN